MRVNSYKNYWEELRLRLYYILFAFSLASFLSYKESDFLFYLILKPLSQQLTKAGSLGLEPMPILFLRLTEAFQAQLYISVLAGLFLIIPFIWCQVWLFIAPALYKEEQRLLLQLIFSSISFLVLGALFAKNILIPQAWAFFLSFSSFQYKGGPESGFSSHKAGFDILANFDYLPSLIPYLELSMEIFFAILLSSQLPLAVFLAIKWGWINEESLSRKRPLLIILFLIWGALISPPDLLSQVLIFLPLIISYEIVILFLFCRKYIQFLYISDGSEIS